LIQRNVEGINGSPAAGLTTGILNSPPVVEGLVWGSLTRIVPVVTALPAAAGHDQDSGRFDSHLVNARECAAARSAPVGIAGGRCVGIEPSGHCIKRIGHLSSFVLRSLASGNREEVSALSVRT
jgi:hypothetical protein